MTAKKTVLVLHFAGLMPLAGIAWQAMSYVAGLARLGYDVWYVEDNGANPYSPKENGLVWDSTFNIAFVRSMMERFGLGERWAYWDPIKGGSYHGLDKDGLFALYGRADAIVNLCGATRLREEHMKCPVRIYVDTDPGFEQIRYLNRDPLALEYLGSHTHFFTYAENLGEPDCLIPSAGLAWHRTRPPVLLDQWRPDYDCARPSYSSVATWQNKGKDIYFQGHYYQWSKHKNFLRFLDLPKRHPERAFELALITPEPHVNAEVAGHGWKLVDPVAVSETMESYADFIRGSRGEFTVAKDIYVRMHSGWTSDRSVTYLAAGRPVITQATAAEKYVPGGRGLFYYDDWDGIGAALERIEADYASHCRAAREIAEAHFDATPILKDMMAKAGV